MEQLLNFEGKHRDNTFFNDSSFWESLFNITSEQVMVIDPSGIILFTNKSLFGFTMSEVVGVSVFKIVPQAYAIILQNKLQEISQIGKKISFDSVIQTKLGKKNMEITIAPVLSQGVLKGYAIATKDTTQVKATQKKYNTKSNLEKLFLTISTKFISLPASKIDAGIDEALELLSRFTESEHAYIILFNNKSGNIAYQWHASHILPASQCHLEAIENNLIETVYSTSTSLPYVIAPNNKECNLKNDCPILVTPMRLENKKYGAIVLVGQKNSPNQWANAYLEPMTLFSNVFINTLERKKQAEVAVIKKEALEQAIADRTLAIELQKKKLENQAKELVIAETKVREINKQLKLANTQLEQTVQERTSSLQKTNQELDRFVYSVSHDIKAPLASVKGLINLVRLSPPNELPYNVSLMEKSIDKLNGFVGDILVHSRNSRVEIKKDLIDFDKEIELVAEGLRHMEFAAQVELKKEISQNAPAVTDQYRLQSILKNLISNAVKYHNPIAGHSWVKIVVDSDPNDIIVAVSDNGIGIEKQYVPKVFDMFYRASENSFGSGLGLYIVKETVDKLKGTISVSSIEGKGTTFRLVLPNLV